MIGGLLKSTSLLALVASASLSVMGSSAQAADLGLGGNCCADLEERIAELEATTARKGNRKVSLTVSGLVNEGLLFWDDGVEKNAYVVTNDQVRTRFRFLGSAKIDTNWSAGYLLEIGVDANRTNNVDQNNAVNKTTAKTVDLRHSAWWLEGKGVGKLWIGQTSSATDSITEINLANMQHFATPQIGDYINGFLIRGSNSQLSGNSFAPGAGTVYGQLGAFGGASQLNPGEGFRYNVVKYDTPTLAGFSGSAAWGEDKFWDIALRYAGEFNGVKLATGIGYQQWDDGTSNPRNCTRVGGITGSNTTCDELGMSGSIQHVATGLYATGAYGYRNDDNRQLLVSKLTPGASTRTKDEFYYIQAGIDQKFNPLGKSTLFGEYYEGNFGAAINGGAGNGGTSSIRGLGNAQPGFGNINSSDINMWGIGFNQAVDAAAMDIYVSYRNYSFDVSNTAGVKANLNDLQTVLTGARIAF